MGGGGGGIHNAKRYQLTHIHQSRPNQPIVINNTNYIIIVIGETLKVCVALSKSVCLLNLNSVIISF